MKLSITQVQLEHRLSALLQLHLHSRLNTWLHWIGQRQLQDETRNIQVWGLCASYIWDFTVITLKWFIKKVIVTITSLLHWSDRTKRHSDNTTIIPLKWSSTSLWQFFYSYIEVIILIITYIIITLKWCNKMSLWWWQYPYIEKNNKTSLWQ